MLYEVVKPVRDTKGRSLIVLKAYLTVKFMFSKKATKNDEIFTVDLTFIKYLVTGSCFTKLSSLSI
jgi:hypothetical protein